MKKELLTAALTATLMMGATGAFAASEAMQEAYEATDEPLAQGSGVTASGQQDGGEFSGGSAATNESMSAVRAETNDTTDIENADALDEINAHGQSEEAGDALKRQ